MIAHRRVTLFAGHYGSGKTNVALNYARYLKREVGGEVTVADLDIVNPYFRTKDSAAALAAEGIGLVVSEYANSNVDFPALPKEIYSLTSPQPSQPSQPPQPPQPPQPSFVVIDVGGDDRGALALGRYVDDIRRENDYEMLAVINASRPLTRTPEDTVEVLREIENASQLPFTGIVNNTNFGQETKAEDVLASLSYADEVARLLAVPVMFTSCCDRLYDELRDKVDNLFPISIQQLYYQLR